MTDDTIGIDVYKATLDVHRLSDGKMTSFSNNTAGFKLLAKFCNETTVIRVVYEATGAYHKEFERSLGAHLPLVNPMENVWAYLRANKLAITVFDTYDEILDKCAQAWNFFANDPERISAITDREWARVT